VGASTLARPKLLPLSHIPRLSQLDGTIIKSWIKQSPQAGHVCTHRQRTAAILASRVAALKLLSKLRQGPEGAAFAKGIFIIGAGWWSG